MYVMHNNRGYHQEVMHVQRLANRRMRVANNGKDFGPIGTKIQNPDIDYAALASRWAWKASDRSTIRAELGPALKRAVEIVKNGQPVVVDVCHTAALRETHEWKFVSLGLAALAASLVLGQGALGGRRRQGQDSLHAGVRLLPVPRHRRTGLVGDRAKARAQSDPL